MERYNIITQSKARGEVKNKRSTYTTMEQVQFKNAEKNFRTDAKSLVEELQPILKDFFVCDLSESKETLFIRFANGQTFRLTVQEIK